MFIDFLSKNDQMIFLSLANEIAIVDGEFDELEQKKLEEFSKRLASHEGITLSNNNDLSKIESIETKRIFLLELIGLCYIDGNYCSKEKQYIHELAKKINIKDEVSIIEDWVLSQVELTKKAIEIINN